TTSDLRQVGAAVDVRRPAQRPHEGEVGGEGAGLPGGRTALGQRPGSTVRSGVLHAQVEGGDVGRRRRGPGRAVELLGEPACGEHVRVRRRDERRGKAHAPRLRAASHARGGGQTESRSTSSGASTCDAISSPRPATRSSSRSVAPRTISTIGFWTVVSGGDVVAAFARLSNPTTDTSPGTSRP